MSTISKVFTIVNVVFALFLLGSVASILARSDDYKTKYDGEVAAKEALRKTMQADLDRVTGENENLQSTNRQLVNDKSDLDSQVQQLTFERNQVRGDNETLQADVTAINTSLSALQKDLSDLQAKNTELADKNDTYRQESLAAGEAKMAAENDRARLEGDLERMQGNISELERQLAELTSERDRMTAEREALVAAGVNITDIIGNTYPLIEGAVSEVGPGFVVLSVGENDGVHVGYPFDVYRGGDYIGRVVVDKVFPDTSLARVTVTRDNMQYRALDSATTRL